MGLPHTMLLVRLTQWWLPQGMADFDWSAIGLLVSSSAGVDVSDATARVQAQVDEDKAKRGD